MPALIIGIIIVCALFSMLFDKLDDLLYNISPFWHDIISFFSTNSYLILGIACFIISILYLVYFKPHKAEKYFKQYKNKLISRQEAITRIADTLYTPAQGLPSVLNSRLTEKRIKALRKRVQAEELFIRDLKSYIRAKEY